jgi:hypothetical protein
MTSLITLPIRLSLEITVRAAKAGAGVVRTLAGALESDKADERAPWPVHDAQPAPAPTNGRTGARPPEPVDAPIDFDAPSAEELAPDHVDADVTVAYEAGPADDVGPTVHVEAPWEGYDQMKAAEIVKRLRSANDATRAVARLYEQHGKARSSVLAAAG